MSAFCLTKQEKNKSTVSRHLLRYEIRKQDLVFSRLKKGKKKRGKNRKPRSPLDRKRKRKGGGLPRETRRFVIEKDLSPPPLSGRLEFIFRRSRMGGDRGKRRKLLLIQNPWRFYRVVQRTRGDQGYGGGDERAVI